MARYTGPKCRVCRSQKQKLMLKGDRCLSVKCPIDKKSSFLRKGPPGRPANARLKKISNYGIQLKEKEKLKEIYGLLEKQFKRFFHMAQRKKGITGENLLVLLETRLDNILYRSHIASSRQQARQLVLHKHVRINDKTANIPSLIVKVGDVVVLKESGKKLIAVLESLKRVGTDGVPSWMEINPDEVRVVIKDLPARKDLVYQGTVNEQLVVELYSK